MITTRYDAFGQEIDPSITSGAWLLSCPKCGEGLGMFQFPPDTTGTAGQVRERYTESFPPNRPCRKCGERLDAEILEVRPL